MLFLDTGMMCICFRITLHVLVVMWCSLIEQKVDQMTAELTRRQQEREDTALQYKRYIH